MLERGLGLGGRGARVTGKPGGERGKLVPPRALARLLLAANVTHPPGPTHTQPPFLLSVRAGAQARSRSLEEHRALAPPGQTTPIERPGGRP
jgi:hypothetical protein